MCSGLMEGAIEYLNCWHCCIVFLKSYVPLFYCRVYIVGIHADRLHTCVQQYVCERCDVTRRLIDARSHVVNMIGAG